jgi:acetyl esterase/lipase
MHAARSAQLIVAAFLMFTQQVTAQDSARVIHLWQNGAPGFENRKSEPEQAKDYWVKNVHNPSVSVFLPPKGKANGAAVIICPGGGHRLLVHDAEGVEPARFLNELGVTAFVLKYRLAREENSPYELFKTSAEDATRALRLVRSRAKEFNIDTSRIGMMGFSAGGEVVTGVAYSDGNAAKQAKDEVDKQSAKVNFQVLIYPGPGGVPDKIDRNAPPAFLLAANNDPCCADPVVKILQLYREAKVPVEVHLYAQGSHAFNMGNRSQLRSIQTWRQRLADWLRDNNILEPGAFKAE